MQRNVPSFLLPVPLVVISSPPPARTLIPCPRPSIKHSAAARAPYRRRYHDGCSLVALVADAAASPPDVGGYRAIAPAQRGGGRHHCPGVVDMTKALDATAPLDRHGAAPMLIPRWEQRGGCPRVVAGVAGDSVGGRRLTGDCCCGARRHRSCLEARGDATERDFGVGVQEEAVLAAGRRAMRRTYRASG